MWSVDRAGSLWCSGSWRTLSLSKCGVILCPCSWYQSMSAGVSSTCTVVCQVFGYLWMVHCRLSSHVDLARPKVFCSLPLKTTTQCSSLNPRVCTEQLWRRYPQLSTPSHFRLLKFLNQVKFILDSVIRLITCGQLFDSHTHDKAHCGRNVNSLCKAMFCKPEVQG